MKGLLLVVVLAVLSVSINAAVVTKEVAAVTYDAVEVQDATRSPNLEVGYVGMYYRLLYREWFRVNPIENTVQFQDVTYQGNAYTQIAAIRAFEESGAQDASAAFTAGALYGNTATVRLTTGVGSGFYYRVEFWGR